MSANHQAPTVEPSPQMDFRALDDDAWYTVRLQLHDDKLRIMYCNFSEGFDEMHSVEAFADFKSIEKFRRRFRPGSTQLQDTNCDVVDKGMLVCASYLFAEDDLRFYDAIVESVNPSIHPLQEGQCRCKFELLWQHGPLCGQKTSLGIEHLCLVRSQVKIINLTLENFLDIAKEKLNSKNKPAPKPSNFALNLAQNSEAETTVHASSPATISPCSSIHSPTVHKSKKPRQHFYSSMHTRNLDVEHTSKHTARGRSEESMVENLEIDIDMGGQSPQKCENFEKKRIFYSCRIDNLEKDLSPFELIHFVQEHLGIPCSAFVCPSISHEFCTRGFILVEVGYQAQKLMDFLLSREYFIVSWRGRPWVIDDACCGTTEGFMPYEVKPSSTRKKLSGQIRLVHKGTDEYHRIRRLHTLHAKFLEEVNFNLMGRLLASERTLMKHSDDEKDVIP